MYLPPIANRLSRSCIVVFSKSYCPYCKATKSLLSSLDADFKVVELDQEGKHFSLPACILYKNQKKPKLYTDTFRSRRLRRPGRSRGHLRPAHRAQRLHLQEAHWWQLGPAEPQQLRQAQGPPHRGRRSQGVSDLPSELIFITVNKYRVQTELRFGVVVTAETDLRHQCATIEWGNPATIYVIDVEYKRHEPKSKERKKGMNEL